MHLNRFLVTFLVAIAIPMAWSQRLAVLSDIHVTPGNANDVQLRRVVDEINAGRKRTKTYEDKSYLNDGYPEILGKKSSERR